MGVPIEIVALRTEYWSWVQKHTKALLCQDTDGLVAIRNGEPVAAVVLDSWTKNSCAGHFVFLDKVAMYPLLDKVFKYVFVFAKRKIILGIAPSSNERALRFVKKLGFSEIYRIKDAVEDGIDYVVSELRKENCKWLESSEEKAA